MPQTLINLLSQKLLFSPPSITPVNSKLILQNRIELSMLRLDEIHPVISGNKIFKLFYFLEEVLLSSHQTIITFGGAYSNHLAATAYAGKQSGIKTIGIVRGEKPDKWSHTLRYCQSQQMQLEFISRADFKNIVQESFQDELINKYGEHTLIPEGGYSIKGAEGASLIAQYFKDNAFTHICVAVGTATTFAGLINSATDHQEVIGFSVLKNMLDIDERLTELSVDKSRKSIYIDQYHYGGYAKKNETLISFINNFYAENSIPLDFVYTGKMMFGIDHLIRQNYFPKGARILCVHTGGLQGNNSLPKGTFQF